MLITNSSLVIPHNLIHKYKHALLNKMFQGFFIGEKEKKHKLKTKEKYVLKKHTN